LSLNKVFRNIQRPVTEPGKGKYWVLDITDGEGYKRERKRRNKRSRLSDGEGEDDDDDDEGSDDEGSTNSLTGSPVLSGHTHLQQHEPQSGVHRVRSMSASRVGNRSPYPQPTPNFSSPAALGGGAGGGGGPSAPPGGSQSYHRVDAALSSSIPGFGRGVFGEAPFKQPAFGQPSLVPVGDRSFPEQDQQLRPNANLNRAHTVPGSRVFPASTAAATYGVMPIENASGMSAPVPLLRRSHSFEQQTHQPVRFPDFIGGLLGYDDAAGVSSGGVLGDYQYDSRMSMGRGGHYSSGHEDRRGRSL
jgi:hypothetical protein